MIGILRKYRTRNFATAPQDCSAKAGTLFDDGFNCAQAVLQAATGRNDPELLSMAEAFGGGIGESGCLCGAVAGGVMALGLSGRADRGGELVDKFRAEFRTTCCRALSKEFRWLSRDHRDNCRHLTVTAAGIVEALLKGR